MEWESYKIHHTIDISEMFSLFEYKFDCGYNVSGESHYFWECVYVIDGDLCASGDGRAYNLSHGEIIFHKPFEFHKLSVPNECGAHIFIFSFNAENEFMQFFKNKVFRLLPEQNDIIFDLLHYLRKNHYEPDENALMELQYMKGLEINPIYAQTITSYITLLLLSLMQNGQTSSASDTPDAQLFREAVVYMRNHVHVQISTQELSAHCNTSLSTLKRIFDKYAGISIHRYFLKLKIQCAVDLLQDGASVSNTALRLGFSSQAYFSKAFKRETGINPSQIQEGLSRQPLYH